MHTGSGMAREAGRSRPVLGISRQTKKSPSGWADSAAWEYAANRFYMLRTWAILRRPRVMLPPSVL